MTCVELDVLVSPPVRGAPVCARRLVHFVGSCANVAQKGTVAGIK